MLANLRQLPRYRGLIQTLVVRELKARYRGSVLGYLWSFINPLLLLLIYSFVFTVVIPNRDERAQPYALFMFCGILPWTWFSASLSEASNSLIANGNLIKKVLFPAEVLPIVSVLANMVHFFLGLPILAFFLIWYQKPIHASELIWFPVVVLVQLLFTTGLALILAAILTGLLSPVPLTSTVETRSEIQEEFRRLQDEREKGLLTQEEFDRLSQQLPWELQDRWLAESNRSGGQAVLAVAPTAYRGKWH